MEEERKEEAVSIVEDLLRSGFRLEGESESRPCAAFILGYSGFRLLTISSHLNSSE
jgi:hypothetical protein